MPTRGEPQRAAAAAPRSPEPPPRRYPVGAQAALERRRALEQRSGRPDLSTAPTPVASAPGGGYRPPRQQRGPVPPTDDRYGLPSADQGQARRQQAAPPARGPVVEPPPGRSWSDGDSYGDDAYRDDRHLDVDDSYGDDYDDYSDAELDDLPKRRGCRRALVVLAVLLVMVIVAGWFAWSWVQGEVDPSGEPGETVLVEIPEGTNTAGIGDVLADADVITNASLWDWYTKLNDPGTIQAGRYQLQTNMSFDEAIDALKADPLPPEVAGFVTVPPGLTQQQIAARLADPDNGVPGVTADQVTSALAEPAVRSPYLPAEAPNLEGTLYPETYAVEEGETAGAFIQRMVRQFDQVATEVDLNGRAAALGISPYQALIVASMIEREAGIPEDGPRVARVIYNRLAANQPLGIDATSCYEQGEIPCELTTAELEDNTPYDTRLKVGLPPSPIASPGRASIEAALNPADGDWLYYVLDAEANDRSSFFTADYDEFLAAKERCAEAGLGCG